MKNKFLKFITTLSLMLICCLGLVACKDNSSQLLYVEITYKNEQQMVDYTTIRLEYGQVYSFSSRDFNVVGHYQDNKTKNMDKLNLSISSDVPEGIVTPVGSYTLNLSYELDSNIYSAIYNVEVVKTVNKPTLSQSSFVLADVSSNFNIEDYFVGFDPDFMYISSREEVLEVGSTNFVMISPNYGCMWSDGTTDYVRFEYTFVGQPVQSPTLKAEYQQGVDFDGSYNKYVDASYFDNFDESTMWISSTNLYSAGTYEILIYLNDTGLVFENGQNVVTIEIVVNPIKISFPTIIGTTLEYKVGGQQPFDNTSGNDLGLYYFSGTPYATDHGDYSVGVGIVEGVKDSCSFDEQTIPDFVRYNQSKDCYEFDWTITRKTVALPTIEQNVYVYDRTIRRPFEHLLFEGYYLDQDSDIEEHTAGNYSAVFKLADDNYMWEDPLVTGDYVISWKILKADLQEGDPAGFSEEYYYNLNNHLIGKNFTIDDVRLDKERYKLSTYTDETNLPFFTGEPIAWQSVSSEDKGEYNKLTYKFVDTDGIIWIKEFKDYQDDSLDKCFIYQTIDVSNKEVGDEQVLYLTYIPLDSDNYNEKVGIRNISTIAEKGSQYMYTNYDYNVVENDIAFYGQTIYVEDIYVNGDENPEIYYTVRKGGDYTFLTEYKQGEECVLDVGTYYIDAYAKESEKYYSVSCFNGTAVVIKPLKIAQEHIANVTASPITYLEALGTSTISGKVYAYGKEVEGTVIWVDTTIVPDATDSLVTRYNICFTPTSHNYEESSSLTLTVKVNPTSNLTYTLPYITHIERNSSYIYEGDMVSEYQTSTASNHGTVKNKKYLTVEGVWSIVASSEKGWIDDDMKLEFTPTDKTRYSTLIIENIVSSSSYKSFYYGVNTMTITKAPDYVFTINDEVKFTGGTLEIELKTLYANVLSTCIKEVPIEVIKKFNDTQYKIYFGDNYTSAIDFDTVIEVDNADGFVSALNQEVTKQTVVYVKEDIAVTEQLGQLEVNGINQLFAIYVPEGVTLEVDKLFVGDETTGVSRYAYDFSVKLEDFAGFIINCGTVRINTLGGVVQIRNFGEFLVEKSYIYILDLYNDTNANMTINSFGIVEEEETVSYQTIYSAMYGHFVNNGTFEYIYIYNEEDYLNSKKYRFHIVRDSYNYGHIEGFIQVSEEVALYIDPDSTMMGSYNGSVTLSGVSDYEIVITVDTADEFYNALVYKEEYKYWIEKFTIVIDGNINLAEYENILSGTASDEEGKFRLLFDDRFKIVVTENGMLALGDKMIVLKYNADKTKIATVVNDGLIAGRIYVNFGASSGGYTSEDYVSGDGSFTYSNPIYGGA
ncbi:MAG: hypothetical protein IKC11_02720 [Clostridia bacterium]|nr:hypothetical protein [Clostridia bacterium]